MGRGSTISKLKPTKRRQRGSHVFTLGRKNISFRHVDPLGKWRSGKDHSGDASDHIGSWHGDKAGDNPPALDPFSLKAI